MNVLHLQRSLLLLVSWLLAATFHSSCTEKAVLPDIVGLHDGQTSSSGMSNEAGTVLVDVVDNDDAVAALDASLTPAHDAAKGSAYVPESSGADAGTGSDLQHSRIVGWGDSLMMRVSAATQEVTGRDVIELGIAGQPSSGVAARMGAVPARITLESDQISGAPVRVTYITSPPLNGLGARVIRGSIADVLGSLFWRPSDVGHGSAYFEFLPDEAPATPVDVAPATPFIPESQFRQDLSLFWMGRNNYGEAEQVLSDIAACVAHLEHNRFLVLSLLNGNYPGEERGGPNYVKISAINERLAMIYGERYVAARELLVAAYDPTSAQDVLDHDADRPPSSLRVDKVHFNAKGAALIANAISARVALFGW